MLKCLHNKKVISLKRKILFLFACCLFFSRTSLSRGDTIPEFPHTEKILISEAIKIADIYADELWEDWSDVPFALLLIDDDYEFLVNHPAPTGDFKSIGKDDLLESEIYYRKKIYSPELLATFPAVGGIPTIVVGKPENTGLSPVEWIFILLHEHFHQYQYSQSDYLQSVEELGLKGGDKTGMWMLNYPFEYDNERVNVQYDSLKKALVNIFRSENPAEEKKLIDHYLKRRGWFTSTLSIEDHKYFSFQVWQEGIARYTEIKMVEMLKDDNYSFPEEIKNLPGSKDIGDYYTEIFNKNLNLLNGLELNESKRNCFYSFGAFEGFLLDRVNPGWRENYPDEKFYIEKLYKN